MSVIYSSLLSRFEGYGVRSIGKGSSKVESSIPLRRHQSRLSSRRRENTKHRLPDTSQKLKTGWWGVGVRVYEGKARISIARSAATYADPAATASSCSP